MAQSWSLSGVASRDATAVERALAEYARTLGVSFGPADPQEPSESLLCILTGPYTTVLYPAGFLEWEAATETLSIQLDLPAFSLQVFNGDLWMYRLYSGGEILDQFSTSPEYFEEDEDDLEEEDDAADDEDSSGDWRGDAAVIADHWPAVNTEDLERYLEHWTEDGEPTGKAYPDDQFAYRDPRQLLDFMKRLGLPFPDAADDKVRRFRWRE